MASRFWVLGTGTWDAANTANWSATSGGAGGQSVPVDGDTVTFDALSGAGTCTVGTGYNPTVTSITMGAYIGTLDFSAFNNSPTMDTFNCSGTGVRTLNMGSGTWTIRGNNATVWTHGTATNLTLNVNTSTVNFTYSGSTGTRAVFCANAAAGPIGATMNITAGSDTFALSGVTSFNAGNLNFTGFTGTVTNVTGNITGNFTMGAGMTWTSSTAALTFTGTSGTQTFTSNGVAINIPITLNATVGVILQLADNLNMDGASARTLTLAQGTFNANNFNVTCGIFSSSNSNTRTLTMGSGTWTLTGSGTNIWATSTTTGLTLTANTATIDCTYSGGTGTRTFSSGAITGGAFYDVKISAGTDTFRFSVSTNTYRNIDYTGFSGIVGGGSGTSVAMIGNLTFSSTSTCEDNATVRAWNMTGTSNQTITSNGVILYHEILKSGAGGTLILADNLNISGASANLYKISMSSGNFDANNKNVTASSFDSSNSNTRTLTMGSGTWTLTGTGTVWDTTTTTGLTVNADTSIILINDASASSKTISASGTLYKLQLAGAGTGTFIIGTNTTALTLNNLTVDTPPHTVQIFAAKTLTCGSLALTGVSGSLNTFESTTATTPFTFSVASGTVSQDYISLKDSTATGGATFYAGANSTNVSGNTGWTFTASPRSGVVIGKSGITNSIGIM